MPTNQRNAMLSRVVEMARDLQQRSLDDVDDTLAGLTDSATSFVPGAQYAGIVITRQDSMQTVAPTHPYVVGLDDIQRRHQQGPCLSAARERHVVRIDDLGADQRWARYGRDALAATPIRSILSLPLVTEPRSMAALNLYAESTGMFDEDSLELGLIFAAYTALAWNMVRRGEQFRSALASRDIIGQAKGMVMERFDVGAVQAFDMLKRLSQTTNSPVVDIARRLVQAGRPPR
jgi:GAF domain-containing protein